MAAQATPCRGGHRCGRGTYGPDPGWRGAVAGSRSAGSTRPAARVPAGPRPRRVPPCGLIEPVPVTARGELPELSSARSDSMTNRTSSASTGGSGSSVVATRPSPRRTRRIGVATRSSSSRPFSTRISSVVPPFSDSWSRSDLGTRIRPAPSMVTRMTQSFRGSQSWLRPGVSPDDASIGPGVGPI